MIKAYFHRFTSALIVAAAALATYSCTEEELPGYDIPDGYYTDATSVELNTYEWTLEAGDTFTLEATVLPEEVYYNEVTWSSDDDSIASVSDDGVVTAHDYGTATITATSVQTSTVSASAIITVAEEVIAVESIQIYRLSTNEAFDNDDFVPVVIQDTVALGIIYTPANATNTDIEWRIDMAEYAAVGMDTGLVTGKMLGDCTVTATYFDDRNITASCGIRVQYMGIDSITIFYRSTVVDPETEIESEVIVYDSTAIGATETILLEVDNEPYNATVISTAWKSANPLVASVDDEGNVTGEAMGTTTITATSTDAYGDTATDTFEISVEKVIAESISLTSAYSSARPGEDFAEDIVVVTSPSYGVADELVWTVSPAGYATVTEHIDEYGDVTATVTAGQTEGDFTITATYANDSEISASIVLSVDAPTNVNIDPEFHGASYPLTDRTLQLSWSYFDTYDGAAGGTGSYNTPTISWSSSNEAIATVDSNGKLTFGEFADYPYGDVTISAKSSYDNTIETVDISIPAGYFRELFDTNKSIGTSNGTNYGFSYFLFNGSSVVSHYSDGYITNTPTAYSNLSTYTYPNADNTNIWYDKQARGDFWCFDESICLLNGKTFPYVAVRIDDVSGMGSGNVKYQTINFSFKTSDNSTITNITPTSYYNFANDSRITPYYLDDGSVILVLDLALTNNSYVYTSLEESSTSYYQAGTISFNHFMYGYQEDQYDSDNNLSASAMTSFTYNLYSVQTFATVADIEAYIASEGRYVIEK
ncbi:MAG: Ig-like domain-containing protein [Rikenellaceae bacterium]